MPEGIEVLPPVHTSFETAYEIADYPYGRRLRCKRRVWIEHSERYGQRFVSCTSNPKRSSLVWNTPHPETYATAVVLYRDLADEGHIKFASISHVWDIESARKFLAKYSAGMDEATIEEIKRQAREVIRVESRPSHKTTTTIDVGSVKQERIETAPRLSEDEAVRLLAEFAPAPKLALEPEPEPELLEALPLFGGQ